MILKLEASKLNLLSCMVYAQVKPKHAQSSMVYSYTKYNDVLRAVTIYNIPTEQLKSAGFGLHPFPVHTALIPITGTRPGSQL